METSRRNYWPYDEVTAAGGNRPDEKFTLKSPWLEFSFAVEDADRARASALLTKLSCGTLGASDFSDLTWLFSSFHQFPLCYILPRAQLSAPPPSSRGPALSLEATVPDLLAALLRDADSNVDTASFARSYLPTQWSWDLEAALDFSRLTAGHDPESLFSVARRYHLLNDLEHNRTGELIKFVQALGNSERGRQAGALVVRQNHYVTSRCEVTLSAALPLAGAAEGALLSFMREEAGHDKILAKALRSMGESPESLPALSSTVILMEVFRSVAARNFLAFSMVVDIFERSSHQKVDPFAQMLLSNGQREAARQVDAHRAINDDGGHENLALTFLLAMGPVPENYAREALRLAELATLVIHQMSRENLDVLRGPATLPAARREKKQKNPRRKRRGLF